MGDFMGKNDWTAFNSTVSTLNWLDTMSANKKLDQIKSDLATQNRSLNAAIAEQERNQRAQIKSHAAQLSKKQKIFEVKEALRRIESDEEESYASKYWRVINIFDIINELSSSDFDDFSDKEYFSETKRYANDLYNKFYGELISYALTLDEIKNFRSLYYTAHCLNFYRECFNVARKGERELSEVVKRVRKKQVFNDIFVCVFPNFLCFFDCLCQNL